jgi:hypothetical protein
VLNTTISVLRGHEHVLRRAAGAAGFAFVATYLLAMAGATFGGVYGVSKLAESSARQQRIGGCGGGGAGRPRVHHD